MTLVHARKWLSSLGVMAVVICGAASTKAVPTESTPEAQPQAYVDPPAVRVYRFHVYSTMKSRWLKTVKIETLVSTSERAVVAGDHCLLERRLDSTSGSSEWAPVAKVVVKKVLPKGRLEVEIESEEPEAKTKRNGKLPYASGQKVRLQIDRVMSAEG